MYHKTILNPKTSRANRVLCWTINPKAVIAELRPERDAARDISWMLLNDDQAIQTMRDEEYGDCAQCNFAIAIFEQALDWRLGLTVIHVIHSIVKQTKKLPKPFELAVNRKGDIFVLFSSGRIWQAK